MPCLFFMVGLTIRPLASPSIPASEASAGFRAFPGSHQGWHRLSSLSGGQEPLQQRTPMHVNDIPLGQTRVDQ
jgi:hypothetical protein